MTDTRSLNAIRAKQATRAIRRCWQTVPAAAMVLGTGLGRLTQHLSVEAELPFADIPHFPRTTAMSHCGTVVCGRLHDIPVILLNGRCHLYEGHSSDDITLPIETMHACGARTLVLSNASGGLNPVFRTGDVMIIDDQINLMGRHDAHGTTRGHIGRPIRPRVVPYDRRLVEQAVTIARTEQFKVHRGVYAGVIGPNYETRAEYRFLRRIGADAVGMSTVLESSIASNLGMRVLGLSVVTNVAKPDAQQIIDPLHVVDAAAQAEPCLRTLVTRLLADLWH